MWLRVRHVTHARPSAEANGKGSGCSGAGGLGEATGARLDFGMTPDRDLVSLVIEPDGICSNLNTEHRETAGPTVPTMANVGTVQSTQGCESPHGRP